VVHFEALVLALTPPVTAIISNITTTSINSAPPSLLHPLSIEHSRFDMKSRPHDLTLVQIPQIIDDICSICDDISCTIHNAHNGRLLDVSYCAHSHQSMAPGRVIRIVSYCTDSKTILCHVSKPGFSVQEPARCRRTPSYSDLCCSVWSLKDRPVWEACIIDTPITGIFNSEMVVGI
jgi:hypothetical protein